MSFYCAVIISIILLAKPDYAQINTDKDSLNNKTPAYNISNDVNYPNRFDTTQPYIFYNNKSKIFTIYKPDYNLIRNKLTYSILYQRSLLPSLNNQTNSIDQFDSFKESLYNALALEYKRRQRYDLGEFGKYLGISRNLLAIILGIISLL